MPNSPILQLIYASAATAPFSARDLTGLLLKARANNRNLDVSGMLIHHAGSFFQVLEGPSPIVETLYRRIETDKRHHRLRTLSREPIAARAFGDWTMGFAQIDSGDLGRLPGFNDFFRQGFALTNAAEGHARAKDLALAFRDGRLRQFVDGG